MSPRPRKVSDDDVFAAAGRVMGRVSAAQLTLVEIAAEVGVTAGALVQRFGSKRGLLVAFAARAGETAGELFELLRGMHASPLRRLEAYAECMAKMGETPAVLAQHLSYLQLDLTDAELRRHTLVQAKAVRAGLRELVLEAVAAGELKAGVEAGALARAIEVTISGSLMTWAFYRKGTAARWIRCDLDALLAPYRVRGGGAGGRLRGGRGRGKRGGGGRSGR